VTRKIEVERMKDKTGAKELGNLKRRAEDFARRMIRVLKRGKGL
jgi:hypothetical protein